MSPRRVKRTVRPNVSDNPVSQTNASGRSSHPRLALKPFLAGGALIAVAGLIWFGGQIQEIRVENSQQASKARDLVSRAIASPFWADNIFWLSTTGLEAELLTAHPDQFAEVKVTKDWLSRAINVRVVERHPVLRWQTTAGEYGLDPQGVIATQLGGGGQTNWPLVVDSTNLDVKVGQAVVPGRFVDFVLAVAEQLKPQTGLRYVKARVTETTNELFVDTDKGYYLRLDTTRPAAEQLETTRLLLAHKVHPTQYIDLRLPQKAYYR